MVGSEHLTCCSARTTGGRPIGADCTRRCDGARRARASQTVRAHAILCDDLGVYREVDGRPRVRLHAARGRVYDALLALGLRPVVELSFMPRDLAADPA